ncbi:hypothetical protein ARMSODRAFT_1083756 [Armillaria solidipes]|uniref:Secreted protein n=1 Tax=Armillaria solidipes TaxID=1076256 RepID=A0A2H3BIT0_9AGAR|nr:hypothetical protein ARMSODRAFT_1083756 [Armillaria solidipes]
MLPTTTLVALTNTVFLLLIVVALTDEDQMFNLVLHLRQDGPSNDDLIFSRLSDRGPCNGDGDDLFRCSIHFAPFLRVTLLRDLLSASDDLDFGHLLVLNIAASSSLLIFEEVDAANAATNTSAFVDSRIRRLWCGVRLSRMLSSLNGTYHKFMWYDP